MLAFPKQQRLLRRVEFSRTMNEGMKIVTPHMVLIARLSGEELTRAGFIVSKKVGGAVERNRVKRRFRELFRNEQQKPSGLDLVIIARGQALPASYEELARSMSEGFKRLQVWMDRESKGKLSAAPMLSEEGFRIPFRTPDISSPTRNPTVDL